MAIYTFKNMETDEVKDFHCSISEYDDFKVTMEEAGWTRVITPVGIIGDSVSLGKTDDGWNDVLKEIKKGSGRVNTIQTK